MNGLIVLDKPAGVTSRDAVNRLQQTIPRGTRIGHTGTLDPLATGVLVVCLGSATRLAEYVQDMPKRYHTRIRLGATSDTDDADGTVTAVPDAAMPTRDAFDAALGAFVGQITQTPPAFSAARVAGRRAYDLARAGAEVALAPRTVCVDGIAVERFEPPEVELTIDCGKGTYIRSLARDLGTALGCGGHVETLRRLRVGDFTTEDAISPDADRPTLAAALLPPERALTSLPRVDVSAETAAGMRQGKWFNGYGLPRPAVAVWSPAGLVGVGLVDPEGRLRPGKNLV